MLQEKAQKTQHMRDAKARKHCFKGDESNYTKTDEIVSPPQSNDQINQYDIIQLQVNEIKISIKETVEMIEYMNSLSNETEAKNEKLMKKNEKIIMEKEELIKQNEKLFSENRTMIHENENLRLKIESLFLDNEKVISENERLNKENEKIIMEKKELIKQNEKLFSENRTLIHENENFRLKIESLFLDNEKVISENERLNKENERLELENENLNSEIIKLENLNKNIVEINNNFKTDLENLQLEKINLYKQFLSLKNEKSQITAENNEHKINLKKITMQTEDYTSQIFDLKNSLEYYIKENNKNVSTILQIQKDNNDLKKRICEYKNSKYSIIPFSQILGCYVCGIGYKQSDFFLSLMNLFGVPKKEFYDCQHVLSSMLHDFVQKLVKENWKLIDRDIILMSDGSYNHIFGTMCFNIFMDFKSEHVLDYDYMDTEEQPDLKRNQYEAAIYKKLLEKLKENDIGKHVKAIMTDGDSKLRNLTEQFNQSHGFDITHLRDHVHGISSIDKIIKSIYQDLETKIHPEIPLIVNSLIKFVNIIRKLKLPPDLNEKCFLNSIQHLQGKHTKYCLHEIDEKCDILIPPEKSEILGPISQKIEKASKLFGEIDCNFTTNICENFFSLKSKYIPKNRFFGCSAKSRFEITILQHENPYLWILDFIKEYPLFELTPDIIQHLKEKRKLVDNDHAYKSQERIKKEQAICKFIRRKACLVEASMDDLGHSEGTLLKQARNSPYCQALVHNIASFSELKKAKKEWELIEILPSRISKKQEKLKKLIDEEQIKKYKDQIAKLSSNLNNANNLFPHHSMEIQSAAKEAYIKKKEKEEEEKAKRKKTKGKLK